MKNLRMLPVYGFFFLTFVQCAPPGGGGDTPPAVRQEVAQVAALDPENGGQFGREIALDGDRLICAAHNDAGSNTLRCAAYIHYRNQGGAGNWGQVKKLTAGDIQEADWYDTAVAIAGDYAVLGSPFVNGAGSNRGAVYIFKRNQGGADNWGLVKTLISPAPEDHGYFGYTIGLSGATLIVGAYGEGDYGQAHLFLRDHGGADNWGLVKTLDSGTVEPWLYYGYEVAIDGELAAVSSPGVSGSGVVCLYRKDQGGTDAWGEIKRLRPDVYVSNDTYGWTVSLRGDIVAVGARGDKGAGTDRGAVYVFARDSGGAGNWGQAKKIILDDGADGDMFGGSVCISGDYLVAGGSWRDTTTAPQHEAAYLFRRDQGGPENWGCVSVCQASDGMADDEFGGAVAVHGATVAVGAREKDGAGYDRGAAYIFEIE